MRICKTVSICKTASIACLIIAASATVALSDGCAQIPNAATLDDGAWLYRSGNEWRAVPRLMEDLRSGKPQTLTFAYVAHEPALKAGRRGILVIKTGIEASDGPNAGKVALVRENYARYSAEETCELYRTFASGSRVKNKSYDDYHDYGEISDDADARTLKSYHVSYLARNGGCKRSDDATVDNYFGWRRRSNRSDFSFDPDVVRSGQHSQFLAQFRFGTAYAASQAERQVTIKRYVADADGLACVVFDATLMPGSFIRVNDLERRNGLFRADEQSWAWPR